MSVAGANREVKKIIVTTTINPPTEAIELFDSMDDFDLIVVGDKKTPANYKLRNGLYVSPEDQVKKYPRLSELIGWNCIQRRNIGFLLALEAGADVVATVDDDNVPKAGWGKNLLIGREVRVREYRCQAVAFDPIGATNYPHLWHRGFPLQLVKQRDYSSYTDTTDVVRIQADFWDGDPDIDAVGRMIHAPDCAFESWAQPFTSSALMPFNSQNTFLDSTLLPEYFMFPGIGRMDDIWGAYYLQAASRVRPVFCPASVTQKRNDHDLTRDFSGEVVGYERTLSLLKSLAAHPQNLFSYLPGSAVAAFLHYRDIASALIARRKGG